jgi:tetratricopeptide (TPR) repeat protein
LAHREAVATYERGLNLLQQRNFARASKLLQAVLDGYPEEKELHERVRLYLKVCQRQTVPPDATPRSTEERVYAATLAINSGSYDAGLAQLETLVRDKADNDHVQYMLAVVHTLRRDPLQALSHLQRSIELNAENRFLAWHDADLEGLREHPKFRAAVGVASTRRERREPARARAR